MKNATPINHHIRKVKTREYIQVLILRTIGNFLVLSSLFMIGKTFYQPVREEIKYFVETKSQKKYIVATKQEADKQEFKYSLYQLSNQPKGEIARLLNVKQVEVLIPEDPNFSIVIPKIGANARVQSNVNAANEGEYLDALKRGVAHALGTAFPGEGGHIFLFAHSTDYFWNVGNYNAIFYLIHKLEKEDEVNIFYQGERFTYRVIDKIVVDPSEVEYLTRKSNREFLTLQTCWPPGTTLKRMLIFAIRVAD